MTDKTHSETWQRLAPIAIIYFTVKAVARLGNLLFYLIPAFAFNYKTILERPSLIIIAGVVIVLLLFSYSTLSYIFYTFRLDKHKVEIKSGILKRLILIYHLEGFKTLN